VKPKRTILVFDETQAPSRRPDLSSLRILLTTRGFKVETAATQEEAGRIMATKPLDLVLVGPRVKCELVSDLILFRYEDWWTEELLERIRIHLVRKRGPKKPVVSEPLPVSGKAVGHG
jgi:hypothetical protein